MKYVIALLIALALPARADQTNRMVWQTYSAYCPETNLDGVLVYLGNVNCLNEGTGGQVPGQSAGVQMQIMVLAPENADRVQVIKVGSTRPASYRLPGGAFVGTIGTLAAAPESAVDTQTRVILLAANVLVMLLGFGFGWKLASRPPIELMS